VKRLLFDAGSIATVISPLLLAVYFMTQGGGQVDSASVILATSELRPAMTAVAEAAGERLETGRNGALLDAVEELYRRRDEAASGLLLVLPEGTAEPLIEALDAALDEFTGSQAAFPGGLGEDDPAIEAQTRANAVIGEVLNTLSLEAQDAVVDDQSGQRRSLVLVALGLGTTTAALLLWRRRALSALRSSERATSTIRQMATQTNRAVRRANAMANYDTLTGLPSRDRFVRLLEVALVEARRTKQGAAVLMVDLSRFKLVNDTLGHASGDRLLIAVAKRLREGLGEQHYLARLGADEFLVLVTGLKRNNAQAGQSAAEVAHELLAALREPFEHDGGELQISASIGFSVFPGRATNAEDLMRQASSALYRAKQRGSNSIEFFDPRHRDPIAGRLQLETELRRAIERDEFRLYYQPQVDMQSQQIHGVEALIRWQHPQRGVVQPSEFVPLLEEMGEIVPVGRWAIARACEDAQRWALAGLPPVRVGITLSVHQFLDPELLSTLRNTIEQTGIDPTRVELEITETIAMTNVEPAVKILNELQDLGVKTALDDFGTGYSSLGRLHEFPVHTLKIDRSFVARLGGKDADPAIVKGVIALGHALELRVIAEGIETDVQAHVLRALGTDLAQGFAYSEPVDEPTMRRLLADGIDPNQLTVLAG
jgi:diguanylate cyclase (GGDEF)-like protein